MRLLPFASSVSILFRSLLLVSAILVQSRAQVADEVDWKLFLARHDMVWEKFPDRFESAAFTGNGHLGAMVFTAGGGKSIKWQMGRSDVAFSSSRIPIGDLLLTPRGRILSGEMRLDLWNAEIRGSITTDKGQIEFRSFTHSSQMVNVFETMAKGDEQATWSWSPGLASDPRKIHKKEALTEKDTNAPPVASREGDIALSFQPLKPGGGHTTAWKVVESENGRSVVYASVGYADQEASSKSEAMNSVKKAVKTGVPSLVASHRAWWQQFWPQSFVSVPDTRLESFYYIQMYKMAAATRPGRPAIDLMGPWFRSTPWAKIWWNLNIQLAYWPQLTSNRLELGQSLCELIDNGASALAKNAGPFAADSAAIGRASGYDCSSPVGDELCNLPWTMHSVPDAWREITFHNLRTQGAFLVSAARKNGKTEWVRIKSLAGEPCRIQPALNGEVKANVPLKPLGSGVYELDLPKGGEAVLHSSATPPNLSVAPVTAEPGRCNYYGIPGTKGALNR